MADNNAQILETDNVVLDPQVDNEVQQNDVISAEVAEDSYTVVYNSQCYFESGMVALIRDGVTVNLASRAQQFDATAATKTLLGEEPTSQLVIFGNIIPFAQLTELLAVFKDIRVVLYDKDQVGDFFAEGELINTHILPLPLNFHDKALPLAHSVLASNMFVKLMCYKFPEFEKGLPKSAQEYVNSQVATWFVKGAAAACKNMTEYRELVRKIALSIKGMELDTEITYRGKLMEEIQEQYRKITAIARVKNANKFKIRYGGETYNAIGLYSWDFATDVHTVVKDFITERAAVVSGEADGKEDRIDFAFIYCEAPKDGQFGYIVQAVSADDKFDMVKMVSHFGGTSQGEDLSWFKRTQLVKLLTYMV